MVQVVKEGSIELVNDLKSENYWQRNKKPRVDFLRDAPFAVDRQLEDQRLLIEKNRNPQLDAVTKVDKPRSDKISVHTGVTRSIAMKANVVNKIVREASGIHTYTIIPPPRIITNPDGKAEREVLQVDTNPRVRPYANESKAKPVLVSFGHRPSSASRTFHPSTMKFRLKQGEILPSTQDLHQQQKKRIGLPVAVLAKVLHAPPIVSLEEVLSKPGTSGDDPDQNYNYSSNKSFTSDEYGVNLEESTLTDQQQRPFDYEGLFFTKDQQAELLYNIKRHESVYDGNKGNKKKPHKLNPLSRHNSKLTQKALQHELVEDSWISTSSNPNIKISKSTVSMLPPITHDDRPAWNEAFHRDHPPANHFFKLKQSGINVKQDKPLSELLHRFSSLTVAENQIHPFCQEKQQLDIIQRSGVVPEVPKSIPVKGQPLYYDPWDVHAAEIQRYYKIVEHQKQEEKKAKKYQAALATIPDVNYYPTTRLREIQLANQLNSIEQQLEAMDYESEGDVDIPGTALVSLERGRVPDSASTLPPYSETMTPSKLNHLNYSEEFDPMLHPTPRTATADAIREEENRMILASSPFPRTASTSSPKARKTLNKKTSSQHLLPSSSSSQRNYMEVLEKEYPDWANAEVELKQSLHQAKKGDREVLYEVNMSKYLDEYQMPNLLLSSSATLPLVPSIESPNASRVSSPKSPSSMLIRKSVSP